MTATPNHGSPYIIYCSCRVFFSHGKAKSRQAVVVATTSRSQRRIVAATPRPFHVSELFGPSPLLPRKIDMQPAVSSSSKPTAPQPASGGLRGQWPSYLALFSHIRV